MADALSKDEIDALLKGMADGEVALDAGSSPRDVAQPVSLVADRDESPRRRFPALALVHERFARELGNVLGGLFETGVAVTRRDTFAHDFSIVRNRLAPGAVHGLFAIAPFGTEALAT